jgi:hypothetical protein
MWKNLRTRHPLKIPWHFDLNGGKGEILPGLPLRTATVDETNLFPRITHVNAILAASFANDLKYGSGHEYISHHIAYFLGVFVQGEGESR